MSAKVIKCVAVGDGFVGKTTLLMRLCKNEIDDEYIPTIFDNHSISTVHNGQNYDIVLVDTAGQEGYSMLRKQLYESVDVFLICFDVTSTDSFSNVRETWLPEIEEIQESHAAKILLGTKSDLRNDPETIDRLNASGGIFVGETVAKNFANSLNMKYIECSSITQTNVQDVIKAVLEVHNVKPPEIKTNSSYSCCINPILRLVQKAVCCKNINY